jgi:hypothetical protein
MKAVFALVFVGTALVAVRPNAGGDKPRPYTFSSRILPLESDANIPPKQRTAKMMKAVFALRFS